MTCDKYLEGRKVGGKNPIKLDFYCELEAGHAGEHRAWDQQNFGHHQRWAENQVSVPSFWEHG